MAHGRENCWYRTQEIFMDAQEPEKEVPEWRWENTSGDDHPTIRAVLCQQNMPASLEGMSDGFLIPGL